MNKIVIATLLCLTTLTHAGTFKKGGICWAGGGSDKFNCSCIEEQNLTIDQIYANGFKIVAIHPESTKSSTKIYIEQQ